ncbi:hypothetical protein LJK87_40475 [Paenibacillus sp. P25]|nr:hypothetical protein LJK87_40475 [Paenibacillus sp. P25]
MFGRKKRVVVWLTMHSGIKIVMSALLIALMLFMFTYELACNENMDVLDHAFIGQNHRSRRRTRGA